MIRRQEFPENIQSVHTDIFWYENLKWGERFLGERVKAVPVHKICAMDMDGPEDFELIEALMAARSALGERHSN